MTEHKGPRNSDELGYVRFPRKMRLPVLFVLIGALLGAPAWMTTMELRAQDHAAKIDQILKEKQQDVELMRQVDKKLCLMCLVLTDKGTCLNRNICDLGQIVPEG